MKWRRIRWDWLMRCETWNRWCRGKRWQMKWWWNWDNVMRKMRRMRWRRCDGIDKREKNVMRVTHRERDAKKINDTKHSQTSSTLPPSLRRTHHPQASLSHPPHLSVPRYWISTSSPWTTSWDWDWDEIEIEIAFTILLPLVPGQSLPSSSSGSST